EGCLMRRPTPASPARSLRTRVAAALEAMPERDRLVLALRLLEGLSPLESAGAPRPRERDGGPRTARPPGAPAAGPHLPPVLGRSGSGGCWGGPRAPARAGPAARRSAPAHAGERDRAPGGRGGRRQLAHRGAATAREPGTRVAARPHRTPASLLAVRARAVRD